MTWCETEMCSQLAKFDNIFRVLLKKKNWKISKCKKHYNNRPHLIDSCAWISINRIENL